MPVMTGIQQTTNGFSLTWDGPSGYYHLYQKSRLQTGSWQAVGNFNLSRIATVTNNYSNNFFRVSGPASAYAGAQACLACHAGVHSTYMFTAHAQAFASLQRIHQDTNSSCLACHTVGYGLPTGFTNAIKTPLLEGVQCENCHGPAANHAANPGDPTVVPRVELAAQVCGGCHSAQLTPSSVVAHHPLGFGFEDWSTSPHGAVVPDVLQSMASSASSISSCGRCHSGSAREAFLEGENPSLTLTNDFNVAITCAVCHDAHQTYVWTNGLNGVITFTNSLTGNVAFITNNELGAIYTNQLRNPYASTNDFVLTTSDVFSNKYNPDHQRLWSVSQRPRLGLDRHQPLAPSLAAVQHAAGHRRRAGGREFPELPLHPFAAGNAVRRVSHADRHEQSERPHLPGGHVSILCYNCHSDPTGLVQFAVVNISNQIQQTKALLDLWATNKAPAALQTNTAPLAWEYTTPGDLSSGGPGPTATEQTN